MATMDCSSTTLAQEAAQHNPIGLNRERCLELFLASATPASRRPAAQAAPPSDHAAGHRFATAAGIELADVAAGGSAEQRARQVLEVVDRISEATVAGAGAMGLPRRALP